MCPWQCTSVRACVCAYVRVVGLSLPALFGWICLCCFFVGGGAARFRSVLLLLLLLQAVTAGGHRLHREEGGATKYRLTVARRQTRKRETERGRGILNIECRHAIRESNAAGKFGRGGLCGWRWGPWVGDNVEGGIRNSLSSSTSVILQSECLTCESAPL